MSSRMCLLRSGTSCETRRKGRDEVLAKRVHRHEDGERRVGRGEEGDVPVFCAEEGGGRRDELRDERGEPGSANDVNGAGGRFAFALEVRGAVLARDSVCRSSRRSRVEHLCGLVQSGGGVEEEEAWIGAHVRDTASGEHGVGREAATFAGCST